MDWRQLLALPYTPPPRPPIGLILHEVGQAAATLAESRWVAKCRMIEQANAWQQHQAAIQRRFRRWI